MADGGCRLSAYIPMCRLTPVDLPCGPEVTARIWPEQWKAFKEGERHTDKHLTVRKAGGYTDPVIGEIKADTQPFDCHGPTGTVVLWHTKILHIAGQNASNDVIRQATIYGLRKHRSHSPTHSWWTTQMATSGGIGPMKCVRNR